MRKAIFFKQGHYANKPYFVSEKTAVQCWWEDLNDGTVIEQVRFYSKKLSVIQIQQAIVKVGRRYFEHENFTAKFYTGELREIA